MRDAVQPGPETGFLPVRSREAGLDPRVGPKDIALVPAGVDVMEVAPFDPVGAPKGRRGRTHQGARELPLLARAVDVVPVGRFDPEGAGELGHISCPAAG